MKKKKNIIIPVIAIAILLGTGTYGINNIYASEDSPQNSIVEKLVAKFNLNRDDVQKVFDEDKEDRGKEMESKFNSMLDAAISKGELTESKKSLILEKRDEFKNSFEFKGDENKGLSRDEIQAKMKTKRESLEKWANDNKIDMKYLIWLGGLGKGGHVGLRGEIHQRDSE